MTILIEDPTFDKELALIAQKTGESMDETIRRAVHERLNRLCLRDPEEVIARLRAISARAREGAVPSRARLSDEEIIGYNEDGLFD